MKSILNFLQKIKTNRQHNKKVNLTIKELSKLSDYDLRDIGIVRGNIVSFAHECHRQEIR